MNSAATLFNLLTFLKFLILSPKFSFVITAKEATLPVQIAILTFVAFDTSCLAMEYIATCLSVPNKPSIKVSISIKIKPPIEVITNGNA